MDTAVSYVTPEASILDYSFDGCISLKRHPESHYTTAHTNMWDKDCCLEVQPSDALGLAYEANITWPAGINTDLINKPVHWQTELHHVLGRIHLSVLLPRSLIMQLQKLQFSTTHPKQHYHGRTCITTFRAMQHANDARVHIYTYTTLEMNTPRSVRHF